MQRPSIPFTFPQVVAIVALCLVAARLTLDLDSVLRDAADSAKSSEVILRLSDDLHADISKTTTFMTHQRIHFELHGLKGKIAQYYSVPGVLVRETDSGPTNYELRPAQIQFGMDHGMILGKVQWRDRLFWFGAPPGWGITREELLAQ